jgi:hypothetical protein
MASVGRARNDAGLDGRADQVARRLATEHSPNGREANKCGCVYRKIRFYNIGDEGRQG